MHWELLILLVLTGAATGLSSGMTRISPTLVSIPSLYFFAPVFGVSFDDIYLPVIATCISACIPIYILEWVKSMKRGQIDIQKLLKFSPGIAMGAVIGAQVLSLIDATVFYIAFTLIALVSCVIPFINFMPKISTSLVIHPAMKLPVGLLVGFLSIISGNSGSVLGEVISSRSGLNRLGTIGGFSSFASVAGLIGFAFPAEPFNEQGMVGFVGAIHIPSLVVLSISHSFFYWFCVDRGSNLDRQVVSVCLSSFVFISLIRLWIM